MTSHNNTPTQAALDIRVHLRSWDAASRYIINVLSMMNRHRSGFSAL